MNLAAVANLRDRFPNLDLIFIESGGDTLAATLLMACPTYCYWRGLFKY